MHTSTGCQTHMTLYFGLPAILTEGCDAMYCFMIVSHNFTIFLTFQAYCHPICNTYTHFCNITSIILALNNSLSMTNCSEDKIRVHERFVIVFEILFSQHCNNAVTLWYVRKTIQD